MKKYLLSILMLSSLFAGTYDNLNPLNFSLKKTDQFMDGEFIEIKRFDAIYEDTSELVLDEIFKTIKQYIAVNKNIKLSVLGHSSDKLNRDDALSLSKELTLKIAKKLEENNIPKEIITLEYRSSKNLGFTTATNDGIELSNRVMLSMYVISGAENKKELIKDISIDKDDDKDGIFNQNDKCLSTPENVKVDINGCPLDEDEDGILDYLDDCLGTPSGVSVDEKGCPIDSDGDGVFDYQDDCADTIKGLSVNDRGCPEIKDLKLNFAHKSSIIPESSYHKVIDFAQYLKENLVYKIQVIGHTDSRGTMAYNQGLSLNRALALKVALIKEGIDANRIETSGRGELEPLMTNITDQGRTANRRIEVKLFN